MLDWDDTPTTVALKQRIRQLESENEYLKSDGFYRPSAIEDLTLMPVHFNATTLSVAASWTSIRDPNSFQLHNIGIAKTDKGDLKLSYFMEEPRLIRGQAHDVLAKLHERVINQLAYEWSKGA